MQVGCVHAAVHRAVSHVVHVLALVHPRGLIAIGECDCGSVEFMSNHALADGVQRRINNRDGVAITQLEMLGEPRRSGHHTAHRVSVEFRNQIEQAGTFGMHRGAGSGQFVDLPPDGVVGGQLGGELLGESAGQHHRVRTLGQSFAERVELDHFSPGGAQHLGVFGVAEGKRPSGRDGNRGWLAGGVADGNHRVPWRVGRLAPGAGDHRGQIDVASDHSSHRLHGEPCATAVLDGGNQTQIPCRQL